MANRMRLGTKILIEEVERKSKTANQQLYRLEKRGGSYTSKASAYNEWKTKVGRRFGRKTDLFVKGDEKATIRNYTNELKALEEWAKYETKTVYGMQQHFQDLASSMGLGKLTFKQAEKQVLNFFEMEKELKKVYRTTSLKYISFGSKDNESWGLIREALDKGINTPRKFRKYLKDNYEDKSLEGRQRRR